VKQKLPTRRMREHPDLEQIKRQAKELLSGFRNADAAAIAEINAHYDAAGAGTFALHDAKLVVARSYGFDNWAKLKAFVDGVTIARLVEAVQAGGFAQVRNMLKARPELANMSASYGDERRALHYAVIHRRTDIVRLLMQSGADARAGIHPHRDATSALTLAHERGYDEIVAIIEEEEERRQVSRKEPDQAAQPVSDAYSVHQAVASGDIQSLSTYQAHGKLVNHVRWESGGLLTVAVRNNRMEVLRFLLDHGFDPDERVASGEGDWTAYSQGYPLWYCAALSRRQMAELLLDRGANPNVHVDSSGSSVYSAYSHQQWDMAELLRSRGGIVTPDIAAIYRQTGLARQMLLDDERGVLPPAVKSANKSLAEELLRFGADGGATEIVRMALDRMDWARDDPRWFGMLSSPLSFWHHIPWLYAGNKAFEREGYLACFRLILESCNVNVLGGLGRAILHEIAAMGDWITGDEVAAFGRAALDAGARMDARDEILKSTPLGWACRWGRVQLVRLFLEHGADSDEHDAEAWARPHAWARKMGHDHILSVLD
jgi:ankyrin repeat protein